MALYFIAHAYGIQAEVVLGGEEAAGKFPYRALRSILDQRTFDVRGHPGRSALLAALRHPLPAVRKRRG